VYAAGSPLCAVMTLHQSRSRTCTRCHMIGTDRYFSNLMDQRHA